ncbi:MAG: adenosine kinase [Acidimicrobiales bacterium]
MPQPRVDVVAVGHALVDVMAPVDDTVVAGLGLAKGTMTLVGPERSDEILSSLGPATAVSGGSAANTAVGAAALGSRAGFVGKVRDDELGRLFGEDIRAAGVAFDVPPAPGGPATGRVVVMVTPDGEKTMCTCLGIGDLLGPDDVDKVLIAEASVVYLEGYLCGLQHTDPTIQAALDAAEAGDTLVALSLSDPLWVHLHRGELAGLLPRVGLLFANAGEACELVGTPVVDAAVTALAECCRTVVVTEGAAGSVVASGRRRVRVPAVPVERIVDTTGAGDLFAAGFVHAHLRGASPDEAARLGSLAAAEVIGHLGARPAGRLDELASAAGLGF